MKEFIKKVKPKDDTLMAISNVCGSLTGACIKMALGIFVVGVVCNFTLDLRKRKELKERFKKEAENV